MNLAERLGHKADAKLVVAHADDVGMCHGANAAFAELGKGDFFTCGSIMVPCPWSSEALEHAATHPEYDVGVHLVLTSEWRHYRWRPLTGTSRTTGLVDGDGYMWRTVAEVAANANLEAAEAEMRAQIETALAAGLKPTHLDSHMGTAFSPRFVETLIRLGKEYGLPIVYTQSWNGYARVVGPGDAPLYGRVEADLAAGGNPIFPFGIETPWVAASESDAAYRQLLASIQPGLTFLAFHPNLTGDIEAIDPPRCHCRTDEVRLARSGRLRAWADAAGLTLVTFREVAEAASLTTIRPEAGHG